MQEIHKSPYCTISYEADNSLMEISYNESTYQMSEAAYKQDLEIYCQKLQQYQPSYTLSDMQNFQFTIAPEVQEWVNALFGKLQAEGTMNTQVRGAIVMSADFFAQVSLEQTLEDSQVEMGNESSLRYFPSRQEAIDWLLQR
ncbi:MAG: hypothetical protein EAZ55_02620 [Cytophagales bacterium]|nr:MAG: hypothetical protein EAZ55_02620 [Cytophagales bacterium]